MLAAVVWNYAEFAPMAQMMKRNRSSCSRAMATKRRLSNTDAIVEGV